MTTRINNIQPDIIKWAILRAGHNVNDYLDKNDTVKSWIEGTKFPTMRQLENFADKMYVPCGYLFLDTPPHESMPIPLFRGSSCVGNMNLNVYETVLTMQYRQEWLEDYINDELDGNVLDYIGSMTIQDGTEKVIDRIRVLLELEENWAFTERDFDSAVNQVSQKMENIGVFISFNGIVGNNTHRKMSVEECRGFALVSTSAPIIFINNADAKSAQLFTLIHEFTHLILGISAGFGGIEDNHNDTVETFCDQVAAEFLVPQMLFVAQWKITECDIEKCAKKFKVSQLVIARRAYALGLLSSHAYQKFYKDYKSNWMINKKIASSGGSFYLSAGKRVGKLFAAYIDSAVKSGYLLHNEAYRLTGLHGKTFDKVISNK